MSYTNFETCEGGSNNLSILQFYTLIFNDRRKEKEKHEFLDQISAHFFLCQQRLQFELINPIEFAFATSFKRLFYICKFVGTGNLIFKDFVTTLLKFLYFYQITDQFMDLTKISSIEQFYIFISMVLGTIYTYTSFSWHMHNVLATRQNVIRNQTCEQNFL